MTTPNLAALAVVRFWLLCSHWQHCGFVLRARMLLLLVR